MLLAEYLVHEQRAKSDLLNRILPKVGWDGGGIGGLGWRELNLSPLVDRGEAGGGRGRAGGAVQLRQRAVFGH